MVQTRQGWEGDETPGVGEEERGDRTAFQNSATGPRARMNLKGEGRGHENGEKGGEGRPSPPPG